MSDEAAANDFKTIPGPTVAESEGNPAAGGDLSGEKEAAAVAAGTLEEESKKAEHGRSERLRNHIHRAVIGIIWIIFGLAAIALLAVAAHYMLPGRFAWLSDDQLSKLQTFLFSGAVTGAAGRYLTTRVI